MNKKLLLPVVAMILMVIFSCRNEKNTSPVADKAAVENQNANPLPSVSQEVMQNLYENSDYTDYIFHHLPFSMSQDEQGSIRMNLAYISPEPNPYIPKNCKPIARQFYHIKGEIVVELDVYYSDECAFYVFMENEKPVASNKMNEAGINFFKSSIQQAMGARNQ